MSLFFIEIQALITCDLKCILLLLLQLFIGVGFLLVALFIDEANISLVYDWNVKTAKHKMCVYCTSVVICCLACLHEIYLSLADEDERSSGQHDGTESSSHLFSGQEIISPYQHPLIPTVYLTRLELPHRIAKSGIVQTCMHY